MNSARDITGQDDAQAGDVRDLLQKILARLPHSFSLELFVREGEVESFAESTWEFLRLVNEAAPRIRIERLDLSGQRAGELGITRSPTLVFDTEVASIRWLGAPLGEEARAFVQALLMFGYRDSGLKEDSRPILERLEKSRQLMIFVSPTCPYCPQQAVNGIRAALARPDLVSLEIIDIQAFPDLAEEYKAFSVPMSFANRVLIAQGAQPEELFLTSVLNMEQAAYFIPETRSERMETDVVIIGGGPAGLTAGIYASRSGLKTVVVEKGQLGGQVATTPVVENYPGLTQIGGKSLVDIMVSHALEYVRILPDEEVLDIARGEPITVTTNRRTLTARAVILATGARYRQLNIPGEARLAGRGVSYCSTCDGPLFKGRSVLMVGGGDSAVTEALHLHQIGVQVTLVHRRAELRAQKHLVGSLQEQDIPVLYETVLEEIKGEDRVREAVVRDKAGGRTRSLPCDGVFIAIGYEPAVDLARKIGLELTPDGFIKRDARHRTNLPGIYSAGDVEGGYKQIVTAAGQGAEAAISVFEDLVSPYWSNQTKQTAPQVS